MVRNISGVKKALAIALALTLALPVMAMAGDGKKYFKQGKKFEENRQWDKAAEQFALAAAEKPSNIEYQLRLQRALVNAAVLLVERADMLADKKDYAAAYNIYRQAFAYDGGNEMALIKMRRMLEAQGLPLDGLPSSGDSAGPKYKLEDPNTKASFMKKAAAAGTPAQLPGTRRFQKTQVIYRGDNLLSVIENLAQSMSLNVVFDTQVANQLRSSRLNIELRDITYPRALEIILKTNNLMYSQIDTRTIVIALDNPASRQRYEPNQVKTFYIKNADITEVRNALTQALQSKSIVPVKQLNALIVRDSPANLELIESLIDSLDKSKAEVLIDINIYEVANNDIKQMGNQFAAPLAGGAVGGGSRPNVTSGFLGGINQQASVLGVAATTLKGPLGFALGLPASAISFFQDRTKAKLLASTQVHAFDREANAVRIGQRVPIQTASVFPGFTPIDNGNNNGNNNNGNNNGRNNNNNNNGFVSGFGGGFPQIQYEDVGLNIDVTPEVYEDEIQMKMKLETSSVENPDSLTPVFNQRTLQSTARIKDGQTSLIAGVSQSIESNSRRGIAFLGLIPILGAFFSTPSTTNRQSDVVITVTPHILRRADIRDSDHLARDVGTAQDPSAKLTLEQVLYLADLEEAQQNQIAAGAGGSPDTKTVAASPPAQQPAATQPQSSSRLREGVVVTPPPTIPASSPINPRPKVENRIVEKPGEPTKPPPDDEDEDDEDDDGEPVASSSAPAQSVNNGQPVQVSVRAASPVASVGQEFYVAIIVNGNTDIGYVNLVMTYDQNLLEVKTVRDGGMIPNSTMTPQHENGVLTVQMERPQGATRSSSRGQLLLVVFKVKAAGQSPLSISEDQTFLRSTAGQVLPLRIQSAQVEAR